MAGATVYQLSVNTLCGNRYAILPWRNSGLSMVKQTPQTKAAMLKITTLRGEKNESNSV